MSFTLESDKVLTVDCDDTLVMWDLSNYPNEPRIILDCWGEVLLVVNHKNINTVRKFKKLGYKIVIWSATGYEWAKKVAEAVGLSDIADLYMTKPRYYVDDLNSTAWMGERLWRDIKDPTPEPEFTNEDLDF